MKPFFWLISFFLTIAASSCSGDDGPAEPLTPEGAHTVFTLRLSRQQVLGAGVTTTGDGTWGGDYDKYPGDGFENSIRPGSVTLTIVSIATGRAVTIPMRATPLNQGDYECRGTTTSMLPIGAARVIVTANVAGDSFTPSDLPDGLPMWGIRESVLDGTQSQHLGEVELLRAVAKIDIRLCDSLACLGFSLSGASISEYNPLGLVEPAHGAEVHATGALAWNPSNPTFCFNPSTAAHQSDARFTVNALHSVFLFPGKNDSTRVTSDALARIYLPEMAVNSPDSVPVSVTLAHGDNRVSYPAALKVPMPLVRNHYLLYTINDIRPTYFTYWVCDWHQKEIDIPAFQ